VKYLFLLASALAIYFAYRWWKLQRVHKLLQANRLHLIEERKRVLGFLHDVGEAFTENLKIEEILKLIIQCSVNTAEAKSGAIFLLDESRKNLEALVIEGLFPPQNPPPEFMESKLVSRAAYLEQTIKSQRITVDDGILGEVVRTGKAILVKNPKDEPRLPIYESEVLRIETFMAVPLIFREQTLGVIAMSNTRDDQPFDDSDVSLVTSLADQAAFAIFNANLHQMLAEKERVDRDLKIAREIQQLLLPTVCPDIPHFQITASNIPAQQVGGDYYDCIQLDDHRWGLAIADVSGKGISGALIMAMCRSALRTKAATNFSPAEVLKQVNRVIHPDIREDMFISIIYGVLDAKAREFTFCRAGHEPLIVFDSIKGKEEILAPRGMALGIDNGKVFDTLLQEHTMTLHKGSVVVLYTDGITEALDSTGQEFGRAQLIEAIHSSAHESAKGITSNLNQRIHRFVGNQPHNDDMTLMVVKAE
jgi:phosphoserine phosphatase RsbU/P